MGENNEATKKWYKFFLWLGIVSLINALTISLIRQQTGVSDTGALSFALMTLFNFLPMFEITKWIVLIFNLVASLWFIWLISAYFLHRKLKNVNNKKGGKWIVLIIIVFISFLIIMSLSSTTDSDKEMRTVIENVKTNKAFIDSEKKKNSDCFEDNNLEITKSIANMCITSLNEIVKKIPVLIESSEQMKKYLEEYVKNNEKSEKSLEINMELIQLPQRMENLQTNVEYLNSLIEYYTYLKNGGGSGDPALLDIINKIQDLNDQIIVQEKNLKESENIDFDFIDK